jgi:(E)-4-hydroxy-3-methyl-but-2-enyl pyrophosphate reductase
MKITIARTAGFCMGVRRAVEMALDAANRDDQPIYTYGPLIHNPQVLAILGQKQISVLEEIPETGRGTVIIRAHGVPPRDKKALKSAGFKVIDATCPRVIRVQSIIAKHAAQGCAVIIVGDREHPEVRGLLGYAGGQGHVIDCLEELQALPDFESAIIVAQTTQNTAFFQAVRDWTTRTHPEYRVFDTICDSTEKRQAEVQSLAQQVDAVVVVGGHNSGNTRRLAEIAVRSGKKTFHVETVEELPIPELAESQSIGITAGASTPNWIIRQLMQHMDQGLTGKGGKFRRYAYILMRSLMLSNLYLALGAAGLAAAAAWLQGISVRPHYPAIAGLYTLSMHTLHHMLDRMADRYNDPDRARFYQENRNGLTILAAAAALGGLAVAWTMGFLFFLLLLCMSLLGMVYNLETEREKDRPARISVFKRIPGSKTVLVTLAWGMAAALIPALDAYGYFSAAGVLAFVWIAGLVFVRTAFFDISDMQGSRIVGRETIPILLGERRTLDLLKAILVALILLLPLGAGAGIVPFSASLLSLCPAAMLGFLVIHERTGRFLGVMQGFVMESHFVFAGLLALICTQMGG